MKVVITGKTGVGKSSILKAMNFKNTLFLDDLVKNTFYVQGHEVFKEVVLVFGREIISEGKINTHKLGHKVLHKKKNLKKLDKIIIPHLINHISSLKGNWLIEMASYINYEKEFKQYFDKVILIERDKNLVLYKFHHIGKHIKTISNKKIKYDLLVENNSTIEDAAEVLKLLIEDKWI